MSAARGSLIAFLDDDDEWDALKLDRQLALLAASPGAGAVECGYDLYDGTKLVRRYVPDPHVDLRRALLEPLTPCLQASTLLLDRRAFEELGGFDPAFPCREDHELWLRLADRYRIASLQAVHVRRRLNHDFPRRETLDGYRALVDTLQPRLEALPPADAARLRASYALHQAVLEGAAGERRRALATLLAGWRQRPASVRAAANLVRIAAGERAWARARRAMPSRAALRRA